MTGNSPFADIAAGAWYAQAVTWAAVNGVVVGYGNGKYGPDDPITREALAVMLYRYEQRSGGYAYPITTSDGADQGRRKPADGITKPINNLFQGGKYFVAKSQLAKLFNAPVDIVTR